MRFASTIHIAVPTDDPLPTTKPILPNPVAEVPPENVTVNEPSTEPQFVPQDAIDDFIDPPAEIDEHIGFLKELGLDYGWGTTSMIQWLLEHVYIYSGFPWWGSIVFTAVAVRVSLLKFYVDAADTSAKMQTLKPAMQPILKRIQQARAARDRVAVMKATQERYAMFQNSGVKFWKLAIPLIQVPLGFGTFRLLRGMGYLPVPGFDQGGVLWFTDLTMPDPYGIMPIITSTSYFLAFKVRHSPHGMHYLFTNTPLLSSMEQPVAK